MQLDLRLPDILALLEQGTAGEIRVTWKGGSDTAPLDLSARLVLEALLGTTVSGMPGRLLGDMQYVRENLPWAVVFGGHDPVGEETVRGLLPLFFARDWAGTHAVLAPALARARTAGEGVRDGRIAFAGNAHIDMAWLWRMEEAVQVCYETFASALDFADRYDFFRYSQSQAQAYQWMEQRFPRLFERMRDKVEGGQWEIVGGMWVEPDLNIPSGEALVRQLLYGKRYFLDRFGVDVKVGYNPDTFGYTYTLPQILKKAGVDSFVTQKLTWNDTNPFPHKVFWWVGPDGSRVLTYFPTTYVHDAQPETVAREHKEYVASTGKRDQLVLYGVGNHGGGPTQESIDRIQAMKRLDVFPRVAESSIGAFMERITQQAGDLPEWHDELYLEYHRGTLTTQAAVKRDNRKSEILLEEAEKLSVLAGIPYPSDELHEAWRLTLFNQFHDILPGSGIGPIYEDAEGQYANVRRLGARVIERALDRLVASVEQRAKGIPLVVANPLSWERKDTVRATVPAWFSDDLALYDTAGRGIPYELIAGEIVFSGVALPPVGYTTLYLRPGRKAREPQVLAIGEDFVENEFLHVVVNRSNGNITSLYDKVRQREVLDADQEGNRLQALADRPAMWDAWNIGYTGEEWPIEEVASVSAMASGRERVALRVVRRFRESTFTQDYVLWRGVPRLDIETTVEWRESHVLVKAAFPVGARADKATFEIAYGTIERPTEPATPRDAARWEVSGHKWIDLTNADGAWGVSLLNDCKYGHDVRGNVMRLTLLRAPKDPDPEADMGVHHFTYSIYPHAGDWREGRTFQRAYELNYPALARFGREGEGGAVPTSRSLVSVAGEGIVVSAAKQSEDGEGAIVVRFYEVYGREAEARLAFDRPVQSAEEVDLLERRVAELPAGGTDLAVTTGPYEIKTLRLRF